MRKLRPEELDRLSADAFARSEKNPFVFVLDNVRSALNVGSVFRTADAFRMAGLYLCGISACPPHREIQKTALGATATVPWRYFEKSTDALESLKADGYTIVAVEQATGSVPLSSYRPDGPTAYVLGHEVTGVGEEALAACDAAVEIPQAGTKHSLNVAVCAGIVAWDQVGKGQQKTP
jgi:tRNA G18 (ribose-2'-O)-methylase SpoU